MNQAKNNIWLIVLAAVPAVGCMGVVGDESSVDTDTDVASAELGSKQMKCKGAHMVQAVAGSGRADNDRNVYEFDWMADVTCRNIDHYEGGAYVLTSVKSGRQGMQVLPELASELAGQLERIAATGSTVELQNHSNGHWQNFKSFTPAAALDLAHELE